MRSGGVLYPIGPQAWPPSGLFLIPQRPSFLPEPLCSAAKPPAPTPAHVPHPGGPAPSAPPHLPQLPRPPVPSLGSRITQEPPGTPTGPPRVSWK